MMMLWCLCSSCLNGATCVDRVNSYRCVCASGFTGANCQTRINACDSLPCLNDATCINLANTSSSSLSAKTPNYQCHCAFGFTGPRCENIVDWCHGTSGPCQNKATCLQTANLFQCLCSAEWTGILCDTMNASCTVTAARLGSFFVVVVVLACSHCF